MEKNNIKKLIYILGLLLPLILSLNGYITNKIFFIYLIPSTIYIFYKSRKMDINTLKVLIFIITLQNLFLVIFSSGMTPTLISLYILLKEVLTIFVVCYCFVRYKRDINLIDILVMVFLIIMIISYFTSDATSIVAKIANLRQLILPILLFYFGNLIDIKDKEYSKVFEIIRNIGKVVFVIGVVQFAIGEKFFEFIDVSDFYVKKGMNQWLVNGKYPLSFVAWDLQQIFGVFMMRFISIFFEALTTGHIMILCFIISIFDKNFRANKKQFYIWSTLFFIGAILTFSKGAYLIILVGFIYLLYQKIYNKKVFYYIVSSIILIVIIAVCVLWNKVISIQMHLKGFWHNIVAAELFGGKGLGNVGVYSSTFSNNNKSAGESLIGNLVGQFGIIVALIFLIIIGLIIYLCIISEKENKEIAIVLIIGVFIEMFLSESSVAFLSTGLYFVISGMFSNTSKLDIIKLRIPKI